MICCAAPFGRSSVPLWRRGGVHTEVIAPGCFAAFLAGGHPIPLVRGHKRRGRKKRDWVICKHLDLFEDERGLWFEFAGPLPLGFTGFSVKLDPVRWRRIGPSSFLLMESGLRHVALLESPDFPAYPQTKTFTDLNYGNTASG